MLPVAVLGMLEEDCSLGDLLRGPEQLALDSGLDIQALDYCTRSG